MDAVEAYDLTKQFSGVTALDRLNLTVEEGASFACVARRGGGKTTLIRLLSGLSRPTAGECSVLGFSPFFESDRLHRMAGTVTDSARLYQEMTLAENLRFFGGLNGVDRNDSLDRSSTLMHGLDIWEGREEKIDDLPTGVVYRAAIARALMHRPKILLLDEPADGMDRETSESIRAFLSELVRQDGMTLVYTTENMDYAAQLCTSFGFLKDGRLLAKGDYESLRKGAGVWYRAVLRLGETEEPPEGLTRREDGLWEKEIQSEEELVQITGQVVKSGYSLYEARLVRPSLEEIYDAAYRGGIQRAGDDDEQDANRESIQTEDSQPPEPGETDEAP